MAEEIPTRIHFDADNPLYELFALAEKAGYVGEIAVQHGINADGRPFTIILGIGDGCETLNKTFKNGLK